MVHSLQKNRGFIIVSLFIVLSDFLFIVLNYHAAHKTLEQDVQEWARQTRNIFEISLDAKATAMQQLATYVASDPRVRELFARGVTAVRNEGGGTGKQRASQARNELYRLVVQSWEVMTSRYDVRQLHFHLGPGSTSFLRVHRPEKFGDNMDQVRYTVVAVNKTLSPTKGFETGRLYSGIRGVVPVFSTDQHGLDEHLGALEAGTSFTVLLSGLKKELECEFAILLNGDHVKRNMWPNFIQSHFNDSHRHEEHFIETTTDEDIKSLLGEADVAAALGSQGGLGLLVDRPSPIQACLFPLRDYRGTTDPDYPDSGSVLVWKSAEKRWNTFKRSVVNNIIFSLLALVVVETILFFVWQFSRKRMSDVIEQQTQEINYNYERLKGLIDAQPIGFFVVSPGSKTIIEANPEIARMLGVDREKLLGHTKNEFIEPIEPAEQRNENISKSRSALECWLLLPGGGRLPVLHFEINTIIFGKKLLIVSLVDISEHKEAEAERIKKEKLQGVLEMAGAICHELNQPLMSISGYAELLMMETPDDSPYQKKVKCIKEHIDRIGEITHKLLNITQYKTKNYLKENIIDIDEASSSRS